MATGAVRGGAREHAVGVAVPDRMALHILRSARESGKLAPSDLIVEATSGNTGISVCAMVRPEHRAPHVQRLGFRAIIHPGRACLPLKDSSDRGLSSSRHVRRSILAAHQSLECTMKHILFPRALLASILLAACGGDGSNGIGPGNQLQVTNAADDFQLQVSNLGNVTATLRYSWANTGDSASINQATVLTGGTATLVIRGPDSVVVYQSDLSGNGTFQSSLSTAGTWFIELRMKRADGDVNFRVQKAP